ncbi:NADPH:quinone oxidoreductase family protein [Alkalihalophilus marmarensis]|jgi:NADPH2:quinone reductase|uniref:NADPH:quinone oxidoreductase family protein n=1 Tax=Alkalihalophilus marmarensis TaxID=521377 RepID=UPI00203AFE6C|nr:NADPH:quinone oxidoreductase family protein [Alkalihalophilus marmarensis]MCM3491617.1 NADPH:quinone oxidoreductase family protein [Alkalihalophilus marmarensis]
MRSWFVTKIGEPNDALEIRETPKPVPQKGEVLIQVKAFSLNFFDILQCQGTYQEKPSLPFTPGAEVAGVIVAKGAGAKIKTGQRVLATPKLPNGGFTEYVTVGEDAVYPIPEDLPFEQAAGMHITYHTAYYALSSKANLQKGESLLIHAGSGGVGSAAIQIGKALGAKVIATVGSAEKQEVCKRLGADVVINYREGDFVQAVKEVTKGKGADVIFDPVGGEVFHRSRKCIAFDGRLLLIGFAGGTIPDAPMNHALIKNYSLVGVHFGYFRKLFPEKVKKAHADLMQLYIAGKINPLIYQQYAFEEVPQALDELGSRHTWGKLVVHP